jgi:hypothetical protein
MLIASVADLITDVKGGNVHNSSKNNNNNNNNSNNNSVVYLHSYAAAQ